ncbi:MAG: PAS domain S-box protein [Rhodothermales bacterium]|nr:PAS domain S-box protein [Rhodothermales bacterium]
MWKILAAYGPPALPGVPGDPGLAVASVDREGVVRGVSPLGAQRWGWKAGDAVPGAVLEALGAVVENTSQPLPVQEGGLNLVGLARSPAHGWVLLGYPAGRRAPASTFKSLIEKGAICILCMQPDGTVTEADAAVAAVTGYAPEAVVGRPFWAEVVHPEDRWKLADALRRAGGEAEWSMLNVRFYGPRRALRLATLYLMPGAPAGGPPVEALVFDVTEQAEVEEALLQSEALYRTFLEQSPMGLLHLDASGLVTFENHAFRQIVGEGVEDAWSGRYLDVVPGLDPALPPLIDRMLDGGEPVRAAAVSFRRAGEALPRTLVVHASPIREAEGHIVGGVMMVEDVTEQRRREDELVLRDRYDRAEEALREAVFGDLNEAVFLHEAAEILGETARADRIHVLVHLGDDGACTTRAAWVRDERDEPFSLFVRSGDYAALRRAVVEEEPLYVRASDAPEAEQPLLALTEAEEVLWAPFYDGGRLGGFILFERTLPPLKGAAGFWEPVERHLMDHVVRLFETLWSWIQVGQRYRLTVATIDDCLFTFTYARDGSRRYLFATPQVEALTGYRAADVLARGEAALPWIDRLVNEEDRARLRAHDDALRAGRESRITYRIDPPEGPPRWLSEQATPHRDTTGRITVSGILMDVSEQKNAQAVLESAQEQARSASRLKNSFVATMSHELRTPLGAVNGYAELLEMELREWEQQAGVRLPPQVLEFAEAVRQNARRVLQMADDLFVLSNMEAGALRLHQAPVPVHPIVQRAAHAVAVLLAEKAVRFRMDLAEEDLVALADAQRLEQILAHLLDNAVKFTDEGEVAVRTYRAGEEVAVEVRDTGVGMEADYLDRLFTPFDQEDDRLNRRYGGTGLGMALVRRLADLMGGRVEVESTKGVGSAFRVYLPAAES